ncbi:MAG: DNA modification methylase, partial [Spirochaetaceae bacterium]
MHRDIVARCELSLQQALVSKDFIPHAHRGFISELYAPKDDSNIRQGERVFYTTRNANFLDIARQCIEGLPENVRHFFIAPLLSQASVHANTSGVFKGFYKNSSTGIGQFGGNNRDALSRIMADITLPFPVFSRFSSDVTVLRQDALEAAGLVPEIDLAYLDPPYNQHPYGSNYFMLNLIADYLRPTKTSRVSGIPHGWQRSAYNRRQDVALELGRLVQKIKAKYLLVSYNSEGYVSFREMGELLASAGSVEVLTTQYNTFRGSRNLRGRSIHVHEYLFLVKTR